MLLGLLTALSYSDLVKSWRGECGGGGIVGNHTYGPSYITRMDHRICTGGLWPVCHTRYLRRRLAAVYICMSDWLSPSVCRM